jgi:nitronate monooxygenase
MAGGPSTPALAAAVCEAGGLGFLAAGYVKPDAVREQIAELRGLTDRSFGVNLFAPPGPPGDRDEVDRYAQVLRPVAERHHAEPGEPRHHDDAFAEKLDLVADEEIAVVSFTFGCPSPEELSRVREAWVTITTPGEARTAAAAGADALVVQGVEAGGHRGGFDDSAPGEIGLLALLQLAGELTDLPLVATGGIATGRGVAAVLAAGASAAQLGTAFMLCPEAATSAPHQAALGEDRPTALTRAFTGRVARGIENEFMRAHEPAPSAYPEIHHLTAPLRAAAREAGDAEAINLWAGQAYPLARELPAGELVRRLAEEARAALSR